MYCFIFPTGWPVQIVPEASDDFRVVETGCFQLFPFGWTFANLEAVLWPSYHPPCSWAGKPTLRFGSRCERRASLCACRKWWVLEVFKNVITFIGLHFFGNKRNDFSLNFVHRIEVFWNSPNNPLIACSTIYLIHKKLVENPRKVSFGLFFPPFAFLASMEVALGYAKEALEKLRTWMEVEPDERDYRVLEDAVVTPCYVDTSKVQNYFLSLHNRRVSRRKHFEWRWFFSVRILKKSFFTHFKTSKFRKIRNPLVKRFQNVISQNK